MGDKEVGCLHLAICILGLCPPDGIILFVNFICPQLMGIEQILKAIKHCKQ